MDAIAIADVEAMYRILSKASDPTIEMPLSERKQSILEGISELIEADVWIWTTGQINPELVGDAMAVSIIDGGWKNERERAEVFRVIIHPDLQPIVTTPLHRAVKEQRTLTQSRDQLMNDDAWYATPATKPWRDAGFDHFILSVYSLGGDSFSALGFHRRLGKPAFEQRDRVIVHIVCQQVDWLHRQGSNVPASDKVIDLSPRERQVMLLLLGGDSRKQVATKLKLSEHTVADYLKEIYRKLGVSSRAALLAKFIPAGVLR